MTADEPVTMKQESTAITQSSNYNHEAWAAMSPYHHSPYDGSAMNEYSGFGSYVSSCMTTAMPPLQSTVQHQHQNQVPPHSTAMGHHQLPLLNTTWPSQLTNPVPASATFSVPSVTLPSKPRIPPTLDTPKLASQAEKGRKTLTTEQKRAMCQFHEENPGTRQADIGLRFGVERSTVSKVLRHKDQFLRRDQDPDPAALKRVGKAKNPDFDRTLSNYVRRQQQQGFDIKDDELMEQARRFAHASGNQDTILGNLTGSWLQKFKQKHGIGSARPNRRASETNMLDMTRQTEISAGKVCLSSKEVSPLSPTHPLSPLSGDRSDEEAHRDQNIEMNFTYRQRNSHSSTSLAGDLRDTTTSSSFSGGTLSPIGSFNFSPESNVSGFQSMPMRHDVSTDFAHREKRNNTFPSIDVDFTHRQGACAEPLTPQLPPPVTASSSTLESPANDIQTPGYALDTGLTSPLILSRSVSNSGAATRLPITPVELSSVSPTREDASKAAKTLLHYLQSGGALFQSSEYQMVAQLTEKLEMPHQNHQPAAAELSKVPEGDTEMIASPSK